VEKPLLIADVNGDEIIVRTLGFFAYAKPSNAPQLILKRRTATVTTRSWLWPGKQRTTRRASSASIDSQTPHGYRDHGGRQWGRDIVRTLGFFAYAKPSNAGWIV
jgi:hypothetical protein